ncbi:MAG TPA: lipopolysaccharide assembly protein LapA domain-containing protein [Alphaproteobacteria bacterium]|nr:lipopolysaccharide assembly protein LapA domain-containing protein [Alphaproteobacteria bacterium]
MKFLFWIIVLALLFVAGFFAVANREVVEIDLWPLLGKVAMPLYFGLVCALAIGFFLGAIVAWWSGRTVRARARQATRRADALQRERDALQAQLDAARPRPPALDAAKPANLPAPAPAAWPSL